MNAVSARSSSRRSVPQPPPPPPTPGWRDSTRLPCPPFVDRGRNLVVLCGRAQLTAGSRYSLARRRSRRRVSPQRDRRPPSGSSRRCCSSLAMYGVSECSPTAFTLREYIGALPTGAIVPFFARVSFFRSARCRPGSPRSQNALPISPSARAQALRARRRTEPASRDIGAERAPTRQAALSLTVSPVSAAARPPSLSRLPANAVSVATLGLLHLLLMERVPLGLRDRDLVVDTGAWRRRD